MFPNATLIADRFHVQRLVLWAMERVRKDIQNTTFPKTSPYLKHNKRILQKRGNNTRWRRAKAALHPLNLMN